MLEGERAEERAVIRVYILGPAALIISFRKYSMSFWPYSDVEAGYVIIMVV